MSSGSSKTTTSSSQTAPWAPAQGQLTDILNQAQALEHSQQGNNVLPSSFAPYSDTTNAALQAINNYSQAPSGALQAANNTVQNLSNPGTAPGTGTLQQLSGGYNDPGNVTADWFSNPASINPYLNAVYSASSQPVIDSVNAIMGQAGRTGSGANQQLLTRNLGDLSANIFGQGYENAANRSLNAAQQLSSNAYNQSVIRGNSANSLNTQFNNQNQQALAAAQLAPALAQQDWTRLFNQLGVGQAYDQQEQARLADQLQQYMYSQQQPWSLLSQYGKIAQGIGSMGNTQNSTSTTKESSSMLPQILSSAIGIAAAPFTGGTSLLGMGLGALGGGAAGAAASSLGSWASGATAGALGNLPSAFTPIYPGMR